jgi:hypothetical protein
MCMFHRGGEFKNRKILGARRQVSDAFSKQARIKTLLAIPANRMRHNVLLEPCEFVLFLHGRRVLRFWAIYYADPFRGDFIPEPWCARFKGVFTYQRGPHFRECCEIKSTIL